MFLLLTLNIFDTFFGAFIVDFEQGNFSWVVHVLTKTVKLSISVLRENKENHAQRHLHECNKDNATKYLIFRNFPHMAKTKESV